MGRYTNQRRLTALAVAAAAALVSVRHASAGAVYWDTNGSTTGSGAATGTWGVDSFWTLSAAGTTATTGTLPTSADDVFIAAGTTVTAGTITLSGTQAASSITFDDNAAITISGGTSLTLGGTGLSSGIFKSNTSTSIISSDVIVNAASSALSINNTSSGSLTVGAIAGSAAGLQTLNVGSNTSGDITLNGSISNGGGGGSVAVVINSVSPVNIQTIGATTLSGSNSFSGGLTLTAGTLNLASNDALGAATSTFTINSGTIDATGGSRTTTNNNPQAWNGDFTFAATNPLDLGTGNVTLGGSRKLTINGTTNALTIGGVIDDGASTFGLTKIGPGTLVLKGVNTYDGVTTLNRGILKLDFSAAADGASDLIKSANAIVFSGSGPNLQIAGKNAPATTNGQSFASTTFTSGAIVIGLTSGNATNTVNFNVGTVARANKLTLDLTKPVSGNIAIGNTNDSTGIVGPWATTGGYTDYAVASGGNVASLAATPKANDNTAGFVWSTDGSTGTLNPALSGGTTLTASRNIHTLRYTGANSTLALAAFDLTTDGILNGGSASALTISSASTGSVVIGASNELVLLGKQTINISAPIKSTAAGQTITLGNNSATSVNLISLTGGLNTTASGLTVVANGNNANVLSGPLAGVNSTVTLAGPGTLSLGNLTGATGHSFEINSTTGGTFTFGGTASTYTGNTTLTAGNLTIGGTTGVVNYFGNGGTLILNGGTFIVPKNNVIATINNPVSISGAATSVAFAASGGGANGNRFATSAALTINDTPTIDLSIVTTSTGIFTLDFNGLVLGANANPTFTGATNVSSTRGVNLTTGTSGTGGVTLASAVANANAATITNNAVNQSITASDQSTIHLKGPFAGGNTGQTLTLSGSGNFRLNGLTPGANDPGIVVNGTGTVWADAANTYVGGTTILAGTLKQASADDRFPTTGRITINGGSLNLGSFNATIGALDGTNSGLVANTTGDRTLTVGNGGANGAFAGVIQDGGPNKVFLAKTGAGTQILTGTDTYTGTTTITAGALQANDAVGLPTAGVLKLDGGVLQSNGVSSFSRTLGTTGTSKFQWTANGGGFSASGGKFTVTPAGGTLIWGVTVGTNLVGTLKFGSPTANAETELTNNINLNAASRTIDVAAGTGGDIATLSGIISTSAGTAGFAKTGTGTLRLNGNNTYNGPTDVNVGKLLINGNQSTAIGAVTVAGVATLGGTGIVGGTVTVLAGGTLAPGASAGTLTTGALSLANTSALAYELATPGTVGSGVNDLVSVNGALTLDGILNVTALGGFGAGTFRLFDYSGALTNNTLSIGTVPGGFNYAIDTATAGQVNLIVSSVGGPPTWNVDSDGAWLTGSNWTGGTSPNAADAQAVLGSIITAPRTVTIGAPGATVGSLTINNASAYTVAGPGALTLSKTGGATLTVTTGNHTISAPITLASDTTITVAAANTLTASTIRGAKALSLASGTLKLADGAGTSKVTALTLAGGTVPTSTLDLGDNKLIIDYTGASVLPTVRAQVNSGRNGYDANVITNWDGKGIVSSKARTDSVAAGFDLYTIGLINNADLADPNIGRDTYTTFGGLATDDSSVLLRYTYSGDADLNGQVDGDDYALIDNAFNLLIPNFGWLSGDFNYDGNIDGDDYALIDSGFLFQGAPIASAAASAVPEPTTLGVLALGAVGLLGKRNRRA